MFFIRLCYVTQNPSQNLNLMRSLNPILFCLFIMCFFNVSNAQKKSGFNFQEQIQPSFTGVLESNQSTEYKIQNSLIDEELSRQLLPITCASTTSIHSIGYSDDYILETTTDSPHYGHLKLWLNSGNSNFSTDFYFNSNATQGFDPGYDSGLYYATAPEFSIYSHLVENNTGIPLAVQAFTPESMNDLVVPLGINADQGEEITISIYESDLPWSIYVYLEDTFNNSLTLLNTNDYILTPAANLSGMGRFFLRFSSEALSTDELALEVLDIYANNIEKTIVISGQSQGDAKALLSDINGRLVLANSLDAGTMRRSIDVSQLNAGLYVIELSNGKNKRRVQKLIIK
ncbi:MAG: hypothetical protein ACJA1H_000767 [Glaciecola sp.]